MEVVAFYGPPGTGKSDRALVIAYENQCSCIIDDGILISSHQSLVTKNKKEAFRLLLLFPYDLDFGMQVHTIGFFDLLLHLMDEREHIFAGGKAIIDEETGVFLADLCIAHRKSFEPQLFEHLSDKMTIGTLEGGSGASFFKGLLRSSSLVEILHQRFDVLLISRL